MNAKPTLEKLQAELVATPYRVVRAMASGGMGDVYEVLHDDLGQQRVMKVLRSHLGNESDAAARLRAEGRALVRMKSPHLVEVVDFGRTTSGRPFLVTEFLDGRTLRAELEARGPFGVGEAVDVALQMLAGLSTVHDARLVHRDIKPDNVFYCKAVAGTRRTVKILDFGVAKFGAEDREAIGGFKPTADGMLVGSPPFMSPEQILGKAIDARTDVYATGLVLFRLLVGRSPYPAGAPLDLLRAQLYDVPEAVSKLASGRTPTELDAVIARAIAKPPSDRWPSAAAFADGLRAAMRAWVATLAPDTILARFEVARSPLAASTPHTPASMAEEPTDTVLDVRPTGRS